MTVLDITKGDGLALTYGQTPHSSLSDSARDADGTDPRTSAAGMDARVVSLISELGAARDKVQKDEADGEITGKVARRRLDTLGLETAKSVAEITRPVALNLSGRLRVARDSYGGAAEPLGGKEVAAILGNGRTDALTTTPGVLNVRAMNRVADELLRLSNDAKSKPKAEALQAIIVSAAAEGDAFTMAALDHGLAPWLRRRVLAAAMIDADMDQRLHREFRAVRDPQRSAEIEVLVELGHHVVSNARAAVQAAEKVAVGGQALAEHVEKALTPLLDALQAVGMAPAAPPIVRPA